MPGAEVCGVRRPGHRSGGSLGFHAHAETGRHSAAGYIRSMPRESLLHGEAMLRDLVRKNSGASLRLITFAGRPNLRPVPQQADKVNIPEGVDPKEGMSTDIEGAMQTGPEHIPGAGSAADFADQRRNENRGHALTAALRARSKGLPSLPCLQAALRLCP